MGQQRLCAGICEHSDMSTPVNGAEWIVSADMRVSRDICCVSARLGDLIRRVGGARRNLSVREFLRQLTQEFLSSFELLGSSCCVCLDQRRSRLEKVEFALVRSVEV
ncbi:hypothetical protein F511_35994 [Dorcoceras hygrometricum]|uniref:Uncharacterized protein n=1 Tax=Dorcoceras hygrometricum TaxID=472368 RepID=A0A2Z7AYJ2_9LAMI|nr:hypothetical protein F511_35994 [Dorcoceras hygrometricum]